MGLDEDFQEELASLNREEHVLHDRISYLIESSRHENDILCDNMDNIDHTPIVIQFSNPENDPPHDDEEQAFIVDFLEIYQILKKSPISTLSIALFEPQLLQYQSFSLPLFILISAQN